MFKRLFPLMILLAVALTLPGIASAQVRYISAPDALYVFLNDIAYVQDSLDLPGGVEVEVLLPATAYVDTLILNENGDRVPRYRVEAGADGHIVRWTTDDADGLLTVTLDYLAYGIRWQPKYDMVINSAENVIFDFFAEVHNTAFNLDNVDLNLIAGRVDTTQQLDTVSTVTTNQIIVGYEAADLSSVGMGAGAATIQHVYPVGDVQAAPGETLYTQLTGGELPARRVYVWNANSDQQVTVIYKVRNIFDLPLAEGIVRSYQDGLFLGSDFVELTPIRGEGSITVGTLQDVRVFTDSSQETVNAINVDTLHTITLEATNFGDDAVTIEMVHRYPSRAQSIEVSDEATIEPGNLVRWLVTIEPGDTITRTFTYMTD
jgi:hypothetical protein